MESASFLGTEKLEEREDTENKTIRDENEMFDGDGWCAATHKCSSTRSVDSEHIFYREIASAARQSPIILVSLSQKIVILSHAFR